MVEVILLAGAVSIELEPYTVEKHDANSHEQQMNAKPTGGQFQWTTKDSKTNNSESNGDGIKRDAFGRPIEVGE